MKKRRSFESGHRRKFLLVVDSSREVEAAVYFSACRAQHTGGSIVMLYVIEPQDFQHWVGVRQVQLEEETTIAKALFRLYRRKLNGDGFDDVISEVVIGEGTKAEAIVEAIEGDEDIAVLVLGAATDAKAGPGPLVSSLAAGTAAAKFPIPITIVPGELQLDEIRMLA